MRQNSYHHYKMREGFSLVEVVIAVTVLAILTIPILAYVTNASVSTSRGRDTQQANVAGETVMEELNAIQSYEELVATPDPASTSEPKWDSVDTSVPEKVEVTKDIILDGFTYHVVANVDYTDSKYTGSSNEYNKYIIPELKEVYSPNNVVFEESDQVETALSEYYYEEKFNYGSADKDTIKAGMTRALCVDVEKTGDIYWVKGYYKFQYGSEEKDVTIRDIKIEANKLKNVYFFYKVLNLSEEVKVNFKGVSDNDISKLNFYFILNNIPSTSNANAYRLNIETKKDGALSGNKPTYITNGVEGDYLEKKVIKRAEGKRIAAITVDVCAQNGEHLVQLKSSKSN